MSKKGSLTKESIIEVLHKNKRRMSPAEIGAAILQRRNSISEMMQRMMVKNPELIIKHKDRKGFVSYSLYSEDIKPKEQKISSTESILPQEPWRGWINPETGYNPAKLGI